MLSAANGIWGAGSFGYDPLDNLRTSTVGARSLVHGYDAGNRLVSLSGSQNLSLGYDANGNLVQRGVQGYAFDIGNRMQSAAGKASYAYDGHGRRVQLAYADGSWRLQFYGQGGQLLLSRHSSQGYTAHVYLGQRLIAESNDVAGVSYSHTDALGSPVARTNALGQLLSRTRYEPYGATAAGTTPTGIGFTGHANDADTGLVYMQQRYYDPVAARFLSVDPIVANANTGDSFNRYVYTENNPYRYRDPDGRVACSTSVSGCREVIVIDHQQQNGSNSGAASGGSTPVVVASADKAPPPPVAVNAPGGPFIDPSWEEVGIVIEGVVNVASVTPAGAPIKAGMAAKSLVVGSKVAKQMGPRGWTRAAIDEAKAAGQQIRAVNKANGNPATRYVHPQTKQSVVIDDVTGEVIHVGGPGFKYGPTSGDLR